MVVVCEKCETRFHLGDSRVPAKGARVRCSRCKHVFFITPPESGEADVIDEVVAEVTGAGGTSVPEVARDLLDPDPEGAELELRGNSGPVELQAEEPFFRGFRRGLAIQRRFARADPGGSGA